MAWDPKDFAEAVRQHEGAQGVEVVQAVDCDPVPVDASLSIATASPAATAASYSSSPVQFAWHTGDKFGGGFGATRLLAADYWTQRARSSQLFEENIYARGVIRRLITNEVNVGLHLEAVPEEEILGLEPDDLAAWSETVENRFRLWEKDPWLCDRAELRTFGQIQQAARAEALVAGDVLVVLHQERSTGLPKVRLINGAHVRTPLAGTPQAGNRIVHGVEIDGLGRHVAFWICVDGLESQRIPAWGEKSGRRIAWLVYGTDRRVDAVRGSPLLTIMLQSLREIDRYRDSAQRKALVNSMLAMWIEKTEDKPGSGVLSGGRGIGRASVVETNEVTGQTQPRNISLANPGWFVEELQHGEKIHAHGSTGTDEAFSEFEAAIIYAVAWCLEIPPEILTLSFQNNYSASQAAINEFKIYLNRVRTDIGDSFCQPIYVEWLLAEVLAGRVKAEGLVEAWRDPALWDRFGAWTSADWSGNVKPSTDIYKQARGYAMMLDRGLISYDRASRELTGTKFSKNVKKLERELAMLRKAGIVVQSENGAYVDPGADQDPDADDQAEQRAPTKRGLGPFRVLAGLRP
jgi:capsid protein